MATGRAMPQSDNRLPLIVTRYRRANSFPAALIIGLAAIILLPFVFGRLILHSAHLALLFAAALSLPALGLGLWWRLHERRLLQRVHAADLCLCERCLYDLRDAGAVCPECGIAFDPRELRLKWGRAFPSLIVPGKWPWVKDEPEKSRSERASVALEDGMAVGEET